MHRMLCWSVLAATQDIPDRLAYTKDFLDFNYISADYKAKTKVSIGLASPRQGCSLYLIDGNRLPLSEYSHLSMLT